MPRASSAATGATPLASFMFDAGQWTTCPPCVASRSRSAASKWTPWMAMNDGPVAPEPVQPRQRRLAVAGAAFRHFVRRLGDVRLDRQVELARVHDDPLERRVADGVRRVRREREREPRLVLQRIADGESRLQVAVGIGGVRRREIEHRQPQHRAHPELDERRPGGVRIEIHVVAAGDAALQHLGGGEPHAVGDERRRHEARLARPDVPFEPDLQRHVVGDAAEQRHRRVRVRVDQPGQQRVRAEHRGAAAARSGRPRPPAAARRRCARRRRSARAPAARRRARRGRSSARRGAGPPVLEQAWSARASRGFELEREDGNGARASGKKSPARGGASFVAGPGYLRTTASPLTSTSTRRFGARQAISSFIAFISHLTPGIGWVLPMPRVSILSFGTPLLTR